MNRSREYSTYYIENTLHVNVRLLNFDDKGVFVKTTHLLIGIRQQFILHTGSYLEKKSE